MTSLPVWLWKKLIDFDAYKGGRCSLTLLSDRHRQQWVNNQTLLQIRTAKEGKADGKQVKCSTLHMYNWCFIKKKKINNNFYPFPLIECSRRHLHCKSLIHSQWLALTHPTVWLVCCLLSTQDLTPHVQDTYAIINTKKWQERKTQNIASIFLFGYAYFHLALNVMQCNAKTMLCSSLY